MLHVSSPYIEGSRYMEIMCIGRQEDRHGFCIYSQQSCFDSLSYQKPRAGHLRITQIRKKFKSIKAGKFGFSNSILDIHFVMSFYKDTYLGENKVVSLKLICCWKLYCFACERISIWTYDTRETAIHASSLKLFR